MAKVRESCVLCACKHLAQARALIIESKTGYPEHYFFALGHLAEAEAELVKKHKALAVILRDYRLQLERDSSFDYPWGQNILMIAKKGDRETTRLIRSVEQRYQRMSLDELMAAWKGEHA